MDTIEQILRQVNIISTSGFGWPAEKLISVNLKVSKCKALAGSYYIPTTPKMQKNEKVLNWFFDDFCFPFCVAAALFPVKQKWEWYGTLKAIRPQSILTFPVHLSFEASVTTRGSGLTGSFRSMPPIGHSSSRLPSVNGSCIVLFHSIPGFWGDVRVDAGRSKEPSLVVSDE